MPLEILEDLVKLNLSKMNYLNILYYRYYQFQVRMGNTDIAPFSSILIIAFIAMLYYFDFFIILSIIFPKSSPDLSWKFNLLLLLFFIFYLYFSLVHKGKWKKIIEIQEKANSNKGKRSSILLPLLAFILFNLGFVIKILQNQGKL